MSNYESWKNYSFYDKVTMIIGCMFTLLMIFAICLFMFFVGTNEYGKQRFRRQIEVVQVDAAETLVEIGKLGKTILEKIEQHITKEKEEEVDSDG